MIEQKIENNTGRKKKTDLHYFDWRHIGYVLASYVIKMTKKLIFPHENNILQAIVEKSDHGLSN